jgi:hypothetical protein
LQDGQAVRALTNLLFFVLALTACTSSAETLPSALPDASREATPQLEEPSPLPAARAAASSPRHEAAPLASYPWLADAHFDVASSLAERFAPPEGFARVPLAPGTFGRWLRTLPLLPPGTPVRSFRGRVVLPGDHENLAAVVALDVGDQDLQQCADSILRLHAEWVFAQGRRDASYRAASGAPMPFARWARGERMVPQGLGFTWTASARPDATHGSYRRWLDGVFAWANTGSLARDTQHVAESDLSPGDFVVQPGAPGHAVLVLDVARAADGRRALLLGQGFMPAQSFQVLRPSKAGAWFLVEPGALGLDTPFWLPFPWKALRRFSGDVSAGCRGEQVGMRKRAGRQP